MSSPSVCLACRTRAMSRQLVLNEEQAMLKASAQEFFSEQMPVSALRALRDSNSADGFDRAAWARMADMGWAGILVPENFGGVDFGHVGLGQVLEEAGRTLAASPLLSTALIGASALVHGASPAQQQAVLPGVAAGTCLLALALEEGPRHQPLHVSFSAKADGDNYLLDGTKQYVIDGHVADYLLVVARTAGAVDDVDGITLFLVPAADAGVRRERLHMVDARNMATITMSGVSVPASSVLGKAGQGRELLETILDSARVGIAAEMLGSGLEAFERTLAYLRLREQFGVPIGSFQALKHRAALMFCEVELTRSAVLAALNALDSSSTESSALASLAKTKACDMLELVSNEAVQMHGGIGMTDDEEIGFFLKRARVQQQAFGDAAFHRDRYATLAGF